MTKKILSVLAASLLLIFTGNASAKLDDYKTATWNMQGGSAGNGENKWTTGVKQMVSGNNQVDVLLIQEAGATPPPSAVRTPRVINYQGTRNIPIHEYEWNIGTRTRAVIRYIYFAETDTGGGGATGGAHRVNTAIVTARRADDVMVLPNPIDEARGRPLLGVGFNRTPVGGMDYFFTIHAFATGGGDAVPSIRAIRNTFVPMDQRNQWMLLGDFNTPQNDEGQQVLRTRLALPANNDLRNVTIVTQPSPTHTGPAGNNLNTLDYAVIGENRTGVTPTANMFNAQLHGQLMSNHTPVVFFSTSQ